MDVSSFPLGTNLTEVRKCAEHPLGDVKPFDFPEDQISLPPSVGVEAKKALVARDDEAW